MVNKMMAEMVSSQGKPLPQVARISVGIPHKQIWRHLDDAGSHEAVGAVGFFPELRVSSYTQIPFVHACIIIVYVTIYTCVSDCTALFTN